MTKDPKHGETGWMDDEVTVQYLKDRLMMEVDELGAAFENCRAEDLTGKCVDVANFAMMIYTRICR